MVQDGCSGRFQARDWVRGKQRPEREGRSNVCLTCHSRDLLGKEPQEKLEIRLCPDGSGQLYVPGLTEFQVQSVDDINKVRSPGDVLEAPPTNSCSGGQNWAPGWAWPPPDSAAWVSPQASPSLSPPKGKAGIGAHL